MREQQKDDDILALYDGLSKSDVPGAPLTPELLRQGFWVTGERMRELTIDGRRIADDTKAYLIAEIGHNHAGSLEKALMMVDDAKAAGADAVKFQTRNPKLVYAPGTQPGAYDFQSDNPQWMADTYGKHREALEFDKTQWKELFDECRRRGVTAFSTPFDHESADLLASLDVPAFKIASGDATNTPLLKHVASFEKPMIVSTGGCYQEDVQRVVDVLDARDAEFAILQCSCIYPAPNDVLNLNVITTYRNRYPYIVTGLSTHDISYFPTVAAFTLGGRIFEHHFTHDRDWKGTDNHFSLDTFDFLQLRNAVDYILPALGSHEKTPDEREESYTLERQKALYWTRDMKRGEIVDENDVLAMCPNPGGDVLQPYEMNMIVGKHLTLPVMKGFPVIRHGRAI